MADITGGGTNDVYTQQKLTQDTTTNNALNQVNNNTYTGQQQALQGQTLTGLSDILSGKANLNTIGNQFNQAAFDYALQQWNNTGAHQLAAQYGAASPMIDAARQQMLLGIAAQQGNMSSQNTLNAFNMAAQYAFTPTGFNNNQTQQNNQNLTADQTSTNWGAIAGTVLDILPSVTF